MPGKKGKSAKYYKKARKSLQNKMTRWGLAKYNIHQYRRYARSIQLPLTSNAQGQDFYTFRFQLSLMTGVTELQALYDNYRIDYIEIKITWSPTATVQLNPNNPGQSTYPLLYYFKDYDTISVPLTVDGMKQYGNLKSRRIVPNRQIRIFVQPAVLDEVRRNSANTTYVPKFKQKIDMSDPDTEHLGLSIGVQHVPNSAQGELNVESIYHVTCFGVR